MNITLSPETEAFITQSVKDGAYGSVNEFMEAAARRQMQETEWFEEKVLDGLKGPVTPLTSDDLRSARSVCGRIH